MSYVERYAAGECEQVWTDMVAAGPLLRRHPVLWLDARSVAEETMRRVGRNLARLEVGLPAIGYRFENPDRVIVPPAAQAAAELDRLEAEVGRLPLAVRTFCEVVGSVDFSGSHPSWPYELLDPLIVEVSVDGTIEHRRDMIEQGALAPDDPFEVDFAPDDLHKAGISGGPPYAVRVPDGSVDGLALREIHQTTFVNYLRQTLRVAGLGGLDAVRRHDHAPRQPPAEVVMLAAELEPF